MSGGKGGSQTTKVEIPAFIEAAARENLARAQRTAQMGYLPYYGPEVAAFSPMQEQAMRATGGAAEAFGLAGPGFDPLAGVPRADEFRGGLRGYGSGGLFEQALGTLQQRSPAQFAQYTGLPTTTPPYTTFDTTPDGPPVMQLPPGTGVPTAGGPGGYSPVYSGPSIDFFDPNLGMEFGVQDRFQTDLADLRQQIEGLRAEPPVSYTDPAVTERLANIEGRLTGYEPFDPSTLQQQIAELRGQPQFDPTDLTARIAGIEGQLGGMTQFDPTDLQTRLGALEGRQGFDPTAIYEQLGEISGRVENFSPFDPTALQQQIAELRGIEQFDPSGLQEQITALQQAPGFDASGLTQRLSALEAAPGFDATGLQNQIQGLQQQFAGFTPFDPSGLQQQIAALQQQPAFDASGILDRLGSLEAAPSFDPAGLQNQIAGLQQQFAGFTPFDPTSLQQQIAANQLALSQMPQFDPSGLQSQIAGLQQQFAGFTPFDPTGLQSQISQLQSAISSLQGAGTAPIATAPIARIGD